MQHLININTQSIIAICTSLINIGVCATLFIIARYLVRKRGEQTKMSIAENKKNMDGLIQKLEAINAEMQQANKKAPFPSFSEFLSWLDKISGDEKGFNAQARARVYNIAELPTTILESLQSALLEDEMFEEAAQVKAELDKRKGK